MTGWKPTSGGFGFVRFIRVDSIQELVRSLNGAQCGNSRLKDNLAKYEQKKEPPPASHYSNRTLEPPSTMEYGCGRRKSYADVVDNRNRVATAPPNPAPPPPPTPTPSSSRRKPSIELRYIGGLNTLLEFEDEEEMNSFLVNCEHIWKPWFKSLIPWKQDMQFNKRITSILLYGVPLHAWCEETFLNIAKTWGTVLILENCEIDNQNLAFGRVGILTNHPGIISSSVTIRVDGIAYQINILEDDWAKDWGTDEMNSDDDFVDSELPDLSPEHSPVLPGSPQAPKVRGSVGDD
ncbi:hypothetical protein L2E82_30206 [Cichorium intybus]|uniref:Uncharacterized protein n=1 Tax=Cichorium intybus TaxID=13427 RepID=A0ACB9CZP0_CICIN|nr:hypothetical protein L2E82_30206 [Cichorium intybus]